MPFACPVIGIAAVSGSGKTTLLANMVPLLRARGLHIGLIKKAHHSFDIDKPGKDSYELRKAGAVQVLVCSDQRWALVVEQDVPTEPALPEMLRNMQMDSLDLVLVEGFKADPIPKIEVYRPVLGRPLLAAADRYVIAVATDDPNSLSINLPVFNLDRPDQVAEFVFQLVLANQARESRGGRVCITETCRSEAGG